MFRVVTPLVHDGLSYSPGDWVDAAAFDAAQLAYLLSCGTLSEDTAVPATAVAVAGSVVGRTPTGSATAPKPAKRR